MANKLIQCSWCGKILKDYVGRGTPYCPGCADAEAKALQKIRAAAEQSPGASAVELSCLAKVPLWQIEHFIDSRKIWARR